LGIFEALKSIFNEKNLGGLPFVKEFIKTHLQIAEK